MSDRFFLLKNSLRHYLRIASIDLPWTESTRRLLLRVGRSRLTVCCKDNASHLAVIREVFAERQYARVAALENVATVLDLGANIGMFTIYCSSYFKEARFICVEPDPENLELLKANIEANGLHGDIIAAAVSAPGSHGSLRLHKSFSSSAHSLVRSEYSSDETVEVAGVGLDQILARFEGMRVDLLKCDVEGAELSVFGGLDPVLLRAVRTLVIEYHSRKIRDALLVQFAGVYRITTDYIINESNGILWLEHI